MKRISVITAAMCFLLLPFCASAQRSELLLEKGWKFFLGDAKGASDSLMMIHLGKKFPCLTTGPSLGLLTGTMTSRM